MRLKVAIWTLEIRKSMNNSKIENKFTKINKLINKKRRKRILTLSNFKKMMISILRMIGERKI